MAIDFTRVTIPAKTEQRAKAALWLNIGYNIEVETSEGKETRFVSLPFGLPVDTQEPVATNSSSEVFAALQAAKNDLLQQIIAAGMAMKPGESKLVNLQVEMRRVNDAQPVVTHPEQNPFVKKLVL